jgi:hypothetical protein
MPRLLLSAHCDSRALLWGMSAAECVNEIGWVRRMSVDFTQPNWETDRFPGRPVARVGAQAAARSSAPAFCGLDPGAVGSQASVGSQIDQKLLYVLSAQYGVPPRLPGPTTRGLSAPLALKRPRRTDPPSPSHFHPMGCTPRAWHYANPRALPTRPPSSMGSPNSGRGALRG